jgi:hypothetical protein
VLVRLAVAASTLALVVVAPASPAAPLSTVRIQASTPVTASGSAHVSGRPAVMTMAAVPRATKNRPDEVSGPSIHVVYVVPAGVKDRHLDTDGVAARAMQAVQRFYARELGGRTLRVDTWHSPAGVVPDVTYLHVPHSKDYVCPVAGDSTESQVAFLQCSSTFTDPVTLVHDDLAKAGLLRDDRRVLALVEGDGGIICGQSEEPADGDTDPTHVGHVAAAFLLSNGCESVFSDLTTSDDGEAVWTLAHELTHNDGAVPPGALHPCLPTARDHVCTAGLANASPTTDSLDPERADLMYPSPGIPLSQAHLDPGHDDYVGATAAIRDLLKSPYLTAK